MLANFACATTQEQEKAEQEEGGQDPNDAAPIALRRGESLPTFRPKATAEANFKRAEDAYKDENYLLAQRYYSYVRRKFPYTKHAVSSELRIGDCQFGRESYLEAIDSFQNFVRMRPGHPRVPYAMFRTGMAYYEQIPGSWFLLPPPEEKDQTAVRDAAAALRSYLDRFPEDKNAAAAQKVFLELRGRLAAHERYAADFYKNLGRDRAYVGRLEVLRVKFSDVSLNPELLLEMAEIYLRLKENKKLAGVYTQLKEQYPKSDEYREVEAFLPQGAKKASEETKKAPAKVIGPAPR